MKFSSKLKVGSLALALLMFSLLLASCGSPTPVAAVATPGANVLPFAGLTPVATAKTTTKTNPTTTKATVPPTVTPVISNLPTVTPPPTLAPKPTNTPLPPTATPAPPTATPTATPAPPTATATAVVASTAAETALPPTATPIAPPPTNLNHYLGLADWWDVAHDAGATAYNGNETTLTASNVSQLKPSWNTVMSSSYAPVWNKQVVIENVGGQFQNFDLTNGNSGATYGVKNPGAAFRVWAAGRIFTLEDNGQYLASYNISDGKQLFRTTHQGSSDQGIANGTISTIAQADGTVLIGSNSGGNGPSTDYILNALSGGVNWKINTGAQSQWRIGGNVAVLYTVGNLTGYNLQSGRQLWQINTKQPMDYIADATRLLEVNTVNSATQPGSVTINSYNISNGQQEWTKKYGGSLQASLLGSNSRQVFVAVTDQSSQTTILYALDATNGNEQWKQTVSNVGPAALAGNLLFVATGGKVSVLNTADGSSVTSIDSGQSQISWLAVAEGHLLVATPNGSNFNLNVYALSS